MIDIFDDDTLVIACTVTGAPNDLVAANITAKVQLQDGKAVATVKSGVIAVTSSTVFTATFGSDTWSPGKWLFQPRVVDGTEQQVVAPKEIRVARAFV